MEPVFCVRTDTDPDSANIAKDATVRVWNRIPREAKTRILTLVKRVWLDPGSIHGEGKPKYYAAFVLNSEHVAIDCSRDGLPSLSDIAKLGCIAHEFGHAYDCAVLGISRAKDDSRPRAEREKQASMYALRWGFEAEMAAMEIATRS